MRLAIGSGLRMRLFPIRRVPELDERPEVVHLERQMMHPFAVFGDELGDEAGLVRRVFDQLDDESTEMEILPVERAGDLLVDGLGTAHRDWKIFRKELV